MHQPPKNRNNVVGRPHGTTRLLKSCLLLLCAFYAGFYVGHHCASNPSSRALKLTTKSLPFYSEGPPVRLYKERDDDDSVATAQDNNVTTKLYSENEVQVMVQQRLDLFTKLHEKGEKRDAFLLEQQQGRNLHQVGPAQPSGQPPTFPEGTRSFVSAMTLVDRDEFARLFDTGVPLDASRKSNSKVLLLHGKRALPPTNSNRSMDSSTGIPVWSNVEDAVQNGNYVNVILTQPSRKDQCIAIMGQYNSYHVHKFMRGGEPTTTFQDQGQVIPMNPSLPLQLVRRGANPVFSYTTKTPTLHETRRFWKQTLQSYLAHLDSYLEQLDPLLKKVAPSNQAVMVMVCNRGQAELLANLVCGARARHLDVSDIVVFATDDETAILAEGLGLTTFRNPHLFRNIPKQHADQYGDDIYAGTIMAKVFCVQLVSMLGYDALFLDVDMVWYKNPLQSFQNMTLQHDIYMQHDGNQGEFYAPYSGNTGFYYVRNNVRTQYFLNHLLVSGDLITATRTHQAPFLSLLSEHASLHGLKVKILPTDEFPGGLHFHHRRTYMEALLSADSRRRQRVDPVIFHMSWSNHKNRKIEFLQQMGEWYLKDRCLPGDEDVHNVTEVALTATDAQLASKCCSIEPFITCHYRPSKIPCRDSPKLGRGSSSR